MKVLNIFLRELTLTLILLLTVTFFIGCKKGDSSIKNNNKILVFATLEPISGIVRDIGGDYVTVNTLVNPGQNPHLFEPSPKQMGILSKATAYFTIGLPLEKSIQNNLGHSVNVKFIDISEGVIRRNIEEHHHDGDDHDGDEHEHKDPHIWLGYAPLKVVVLNTYKQLSLLMPEKKQYFKANYDKYIKDLDSVNNEIKALLAPFKGSTIMVFHPSFGYFTDTYGLEQKAIEFEGKAPTPKRFAELVGESKGKLHVLFIQPQFDQLTSQSIAKTVGAKVSVIDPMAPNVKENMLQIAKKIYSSLKDGAN